MLWSSNWTCYITICSFIWWRPTPTKAKSVKKLPKISRDLVLNSVSFSFEHVLYCRLFSDRVNSKAISTKFSAWLLNAYRWFRDRLIISALATCRRSWVHGGIHPEVAVLQRWQDCFPDATDIWCCCQRWICYTRIGNGRNLPWRSELVPAELVLWLDTLMVWPDVRVFHIMSTISGGNTCDRWIFLSLSDSSTTLQYTTF